MKIIMLSILLLLWLNTKNGNVVDPILQFFQLELVLIENTILHCQDLLVLRDMKSRKLTVLSKINEHEN